MTTAEAIARTKQRAHVLEEELLYWATEIGRAEEAGAATEMQVQAIQSALVLARSEIAGLRSMLEDDLDLSDEEAEVFVHLNRELARISDEYEGLHQRSVKLFQPKQRSEPPLPTSFEAH